MLRIVLVGHSARSENLGVGALTVAQIAILRGIAADLGRDIRFTIIEGKSDNQGGMPAYVAGPDIALVTITGRDLIDPRGFLALVRGADLVIDIGAGDSFADIYGARRLQRMYLVKYLVHLARRPLVTAPQTIGPFERRISRWLATGSLRLSAVVATRDRMSTDCALGLGLPAARIIEASDVALRLPFTPPAPRLSGGPLRVGLNVSGLLMRGGYTRSNMFGLKADYPATLRDIIARFRAHRDSCEVHLVPHVITRKRGWVEDDYQPSLDLAAAFPGTLVAPPFATPSEAKSYIAGLDYFAGARMHACIAAFSSGVPVVPMAYSRKFAGLFGSLGYDHTVDCTTESAGTIADAVLAGYANRAALESDRRAALARGLERLGRYEAALRTLLARVPAR